MRLILPLLALSLLSLGACKRGSEPVVQAAPTAASVAAPSEAAQAAFLGKVRSALKGGKVAGLQALGVWDKASRQSLGVLPGLFRQEIERCAQEDCSVSLEPSDKFAGLGMTAPAFGELVITHKSADMVSRTRLPVGVKDGQVVLVTLAQ